jgi:hypothetical protein
MNLQKEFAKTKHVVQTWSKMLYKKETFHAYLVSSYIGSIPSNLYTYIMQTSSIMHFYICFGLCWHQSPTQIIGLTSLPKCIDYTGVKGSHSANKKTKFLDSTKEQRGNRRHPWSGAPDCLVRHRTCPVHQGDSDSNSPPSGISRGTRAIIHRTVRCTPDSVRCAMEKRPQELASFGKLQRLVHYNSPDCPVCTGLSGASPEQRLSPRQRLSAEQ